MAQATLIIVLLLLVTLAIGAPVSGSMGFTAVVAMAVLVGFNFLPSFATTAFSQVVSSNQLIAPLFVMMAEFLSRGGIAEDIYYVINKYLKKLKGGLAVSTLVACTIFAALCGSSPATAASIGKVSIEAMTKRGYRADFAIGTVAGGGTLGIMIPPSLTFVQFGILTETSIAKLLMAGLLPGIMLALIMIVFALLRVHINPELIGQPKRKNFFSGRTAEEKPKFIDYDEGKKTTVLQDIGLAVPCLALIFVIIFFMYSGIATPTESAGYGVIGALIIVLIRRRINKKSFFSALSATANTSAMMLFMMITGLCLSQVITRVGIASALATAIANSGVSKWVVLILLYLLWFILGMLMSPGSMVVLTIPFIFPTLVSLGFDPLWIGVVCVLCVEIGMITPPVGLNLFVLKNTTKADIGTIIKGSLPYVGALLFGLLVLTIFPQIALVIPGNM